MENLEKKIAFERIKLSILKINNISQIKSTRNWINLFYNKYKSNEDKSFLIGYLEQWAEFNLN